VYGTTIWVSDKTKSRLEKIKSEITRMRAKNPDNAFVVTPTLEQALDVLEERLNESALEKE